MPEVIINGPEGRLEAKYHHAKTNAPVAVILHPHPEQGGTMNDKVTYALYRTFSHNGYNTLRFNFRGVGKSEGVFDEGEGELSDAAAVLDWLQAHNPNAPASWVGGSSFGAWIAMQLLMRRPELDGFVAINPPAKGKDFTFLAPCPVSGLFIQGESSPEELKAVTDLAATLTAQRNVYVTENYIPGADSAFTNKLKEIMDLTQAYLRGGHQDGMAKSA
jgi:alpha/beta superfamily hydrolase